MKLALHRRFLGRGRAAILACLTCISQPCLAGDGEPAPGSVVDIKPVVEHLVFATDGKGHFVAATPFFGDSSANSFYSADGKQFVQLRITGGGSSGTESWDKIFWEPRVDSRWQGGFGWKNGEWSVQCADRKTILQQVPMDAAKKLAADAKFIYGTWDRHAHGLARDNAGTYFFVDRGVGEKAKNFRVFMGPRGRLKPIPLTNVVSDSEGDIFATKEGTLRLILGRGEKSESTWIKGKTTNRLVVLPLDDNRKMIYTDLGIYTGQRLGTPCDDL